MSRIRQFISSFIFLLFLVFCQQSDVNAKGGHLIRNQGFFYGVEGFYGYGKELNSDYIINTPAYSPASYGVKATINRFVNYHLSVGGGLGLLRYESPGMLSFPVFINSQAYLSKGSNTPLIYVEGGYGLRFNHKNQDKGFLYEFGLGYRYRIKWKNFLVLKVGYHSYNNKEWLWERKLGADYDLSDPYQWFSLKRQTISFTIGFYYSTRY